MATSSSLAAQNKAALDYFVQTPVTREMVAYLAMKASEVIRCGNEAAAPAGDLPTPPTTPPPNASDPTLPPLEAFITSIIQQSHVQVPTLMPALIYLARLKARLPPVAQGIPSTVHRIFLATLILAAKNLNDSSPKNKHWARYTTVPGYPAFSFTNSEVNLMEKQLLYLLDWNMNITNEDLCFHLEPFLAPIRVKQVQRAERKMQEMLREHEQAQIRQQQQEHKQRQQSMSALASTSQVNLPHIVALARQHSFTPSRTIYDSPASTIYSASSATDSPAYASSTCSYTRSRSESLVPPSLTHSRSSSRAPPSRTPSLSPPSRCDSSLSLMSSVCGTPASYTATAPYPSKPQEAKCAMPSHPSESCYPYGASYSYTYMHHDLPEVVHIQPVGSAHSQKDLPVPVVPSQMGLQKPLPLPMPTPALQPAGKRLRSAGAGFLNRLIGNGVPQVQGQTQGQLQPVVGVAAC